MIAAALVPRTRAVVISVGSVGMVSTLGTADWNPRPPFTLQPFDLFLVFEQVPRDDGQFRERVRQVPFHHPPGVGPRIVRVCEVWFAYAFVRSARVELANYGVANRG